MTTAPNKSPEAISTDRAKYPGAQIPAEKNGSLRAPIPTEIEGEGQVVQNQMRALTKNPILAKDKKGRVVRQMKKRGQQKPSSNPKMPSLRVGTHCPQQL